MDDDDDIEALICMLMQDEEASYQAEEDIRHIATLGSAYIYYSALESCRLRAECQALTRLYLTHPQLIPDPRGMTPWQVLYKSRSDCAFITTMGFNVAFFDKLLEGGFEEQWISQVIPCRDVACSSTPRVYRRSLDAAGALGLVLHYLNSTILEISLMEIFALIPTTVSQYISFALEILCNLLHSIPDASIRWPKDHEFIQNETLILARHPLLVVWMA
ncbi:hypothetical protein F5051DRAFT_446896 [Lentinula edodes]|nr:hypothetical protein F5051DRAFT_446896 [Lentinula edodes]